MTPCYAPTLASAQGSLQTHIPKSRIEYWRPKAVPPRVSRRALQWDLIRTFRDRETEVLYATGRSRRFQSCARQAFQKLRMIDAAKQLTDLSALPGNRLEALKGDRRGQYSVRINDRYRACFEWRGGEAYEVGVTDYH